MKLMILELKYTKILYEYYTNKTKLKKKQTNRFNEVINNSNELHECLLNKEASIDNNAPYELDKLFEYYEYYKRILTRSSFESNYVKYTSSSDFASSIDVYFENIKFYLSNLICYYILKGEWKIQLSMQISFISLTNEETDIMHSKSDNVEIMRGRSTNDILNRLIETFKQSYQEGLKSKATFLLFMCNAICKYVKARYKYMKNYDNTKESKYLMYVDENNLYRWAMSKKLPIHNFKWETDLSIFTSDFIKNYNEKSDIGYLFYVDITYPKELYELHKDLPLLPDRMEVNQVNKLIASVYDKNNYAIHIYTLKQALNHG